MTLMEDRVDTASTAPPAVLHPLEPLLPEEIAAASALLRRHDEVPSTTRFVFVELCEPPKAELLAWTPGTPWDR